MKFMLHIFIYLSLTMIHCAYAVSGSLNKNNHTFPMNFVGKMLISVSDGDMVGSAYVDGKLGSREGNDVISIIPLGKPIKDLQAYEANVSNSVAGPAVAVTVTPDGHYAFVVETFKARPEGDWEKQKFSSLKKGNIITVVDLLEPTKPIVVQKLTVSQRPDAVSINSKGDLLSVTFHPNDKSRPLALIPFKSGRLSKPFYPETSLLPKENRLIQAEWHPTKSMLAIVDNTAAIISFVHVNKTNTGYHLKPWGNSVQIGKSPYMVRFTPNGKYLIANNLYWGADVQGKWVEAPRGDVVSIRLNAGKQKNGLIPVGGRKMRQALV